jgi:carbonic anhydrase
MSIEPQNVVVSPLVYWPQQSPIDLRYIEARKADFAPGYLDVLYPTKAIPGVFKEHNFVPADPKPAIMFDGSRCNLIKAHIHSPAEHHLDGIIHDFEIHLVHEIPSPSKGSKLVVIGIFFTEKPGAKTPSAIKALNRELAKASAASGDCSSSISISIKLKDFLPDDWEDFFYRYEGSLTTPNYDEFVSWIVMAHAVEVEPADVVDLKRCTQHMARPLQQLNRRFVLRSIV